MKKIFNVCDINDEEEICLHRTKKGAEICLKEKQKYEKGKDFKIIEEEADQDLFNEIEE